MSIINKFDKIKKEISDVSVNIKTEIIAVSKTFSMSQIKPLIDHGHRHFGENKVQEAEKKWSETKKTIPDLKLHMIGSLQSNKAKKAVELFDYIHSLDSEKLAKELCKRQLEIRKDLNYFIQINLGSEEQKGGLNIDDLTSFYNYCSNDLKLSIIGLMAIPPNDNAAEKYFKQISELNKKIGLAQLSIGMSNDYLDAIKYGASHVRIGSAIFGNRN
tara:strand:- start:767 stop:1414 length:648 start_codon:yes stop_codon:yes gene_type:complete